MVRYIHIIFLFFAASLTAGAQTPCAETELCTAEMVSVEICPEFCDLGPAYSITTVSSTYNCSVQNLGNCIIYTSLPGMTIIGWDYLMIQACNNVGTCEDYGVAVTIIDNCDEENESPGEDDDPPVEDCLNDISNNCAELHQTIEICPTFCQFEDGYQITGITGIDECSIGEIDGPCFSFTSLPAQEEELVLTVEACHSSGACGTVEVHIGISDCNGDGILGNGELEYADYEAIFGMVDAENGNPVTINDELISQCEVMLIDVMENDWDPEDDHMFICAIDPAEHGQVILIGDQLIKYIPNQNFTGTDYFDYYLCDVNGGYSWGQVMIESSCDNDCPIEPFQACTNVDEAITICPSYCNEDGMQIQSISSPFPCSLFDWDVDCFTYIPPQNFAGEIPIVVTACNEENNENCTEQEIVLNVQLYCSGVLSPDNNSLVGGVETSLEPALSDECKIRVPSGFSPNGDGVNDRYYINFGSCNDSYTGQFLVFDRTGKEVFRFVDDIQWLNWDGRNSAGNELPIGSYFYIVLINNEYKKGSISLSR